MFITDDAAFSVGQRVCVHHDWTVGATHLTGWRVRHVWAELVDGEMAVPLTQDDLDEHTALREIIAAVEQDRLAQMVAGLSGPERERVERTIRRFTQRAADLENLARGDLRFVVVTSMMWEASTRDRDVVVRSERLEPGRVIHDTLDQANADVLAHPPVFERDGVDPAGILGTVVPPPTRWP